MFWTWHQQHRQKKAKIDKWDHIKLKSFCSAKETIERMQVQCTEWKEIFVNLIFDTELIFKIYKESFVYDYIVFGSS